MDTAVRNMDIARFDSGHGHDANDCGRDRDPDHSLDPAKQSFEALEWKRLARMPNAAAEPTAGEPSRRKRPK